MNRPLFNLSTALFCIACLTSLAARAQEAARPWYASATLGAATQSSQDVGYSGSDGSASGRASYDPGLLAGAAIGRVWAGGWRTELEFMYQTTDLKNAFAAGSGGPVGGGNHASTSFALNGLREFDLLGSPTVRTYIGIGVVYVSEVDIDFESAGSAERSFSGDGAGWQLLAGARYDLGQRWFVDAGVRYLRMNSRTLSSENGGGDSVRLAYRPWALSAALGWRF